MKNDYLSVISKRIKDKNTQKQIYSELEGHIQDKIEYYKELGYSDDEAEKRAVEDMGEPDDAALPLRELHNGAGRNLLIIISLIFFAAVAVVPFFFHKFNYADSYYRAVYHLITVDFLSVAVVAGYIFFLIKAFKMKSKLIPLFAAATLLISNFTGMAIFRPAAYSAVKIATSGIGGYFDSIFGYGIFPENMKIPLAVGSYVIFAILLIWSVVQFVTVFMQERLYNTKKLNCFIRIFRRAVSVLLCLNLIVGTAGTVIAAVYLPQKRESLHKERIEMINEVINTPIGKITASSPDSFKETVSYGSGGNNTLTTMSGFGIYYARTDFDLPFDMLENYTVDSSLLYNRRFENLQEFFDEGLYGKALLVSKLSPQAIIFNVYTSENKIAVITFECPDREAEKSDLSKYIFVSNNDGYFETNYEQGSELNENQ
ncbi:MAG: permease prefix domain 1-containing protein [Oscillospiraceae bacterium]|nr:permease prefix domain 1-containing protein [Oscillospiraceae bacterium]